MEGIIVNFRGSHKTKYMNQLIIKVDGCDTKEAAEKLEKKNVVWKSPAGKEIKGVIVKAHGNKGAVRTKFERGLPGQSLGSKVKIE